MAVPGALALALAVTWVDGQVGCVVDSDDVEGYEHRIKAATSYTALFDRLASLRDWQGRPVALYSRDFLRARMFCHMLPSRSLSNLPDIGDGTLSKQTREVLERLGDAHGRIVWSEMLALSSLLSISDDDLQTVLFAADSDSSGFLSEAELRRALGYLVLRELLVSGDDSAFTSALQWRGEAAGSLGAPLSGTLHFPEADDSDESDESSEDDERGDHPQQPPDPGATTARVSSSLDVPPPRCILECGRMDSSVLSLSVSDLYDPRKICDFARRLRVAVAEYEFRVFADAATFLKHHKKLTLRDAGTTVLYEDSPPFFSKSSVAPVDSMMMTPSGFARYILCQSHARPRRMAMLLERWETRVRGNTALIHDPLSGSPKQVVDPGANVRRLTAFASVDPMDIITVKSFPLIREALVDRSEDLIRALRLLLGVRTPRHRKDKVLDSHAVVTAAVFAQAARAVNGAMIPSHAIEALLCIASSTPPNHDEVSVTASLKDVELLLARHAARSVGRPRKDVKLWDAFVECVTGQSALHDATPEEERAAKLARA
jgi:hypothetical protein